MPNVPKKRDQSPHDVAWDDDDQLPGLQNELDAPSQPFLRRQTNKRRASDVHELRHRPRLGPAELKKRFGALGLRPTTREDRLAEALSGLETEPEVPWEEMPKEITESADALRKPGVRRFHGAKFSLAYFPASGLRSPCADRFGYMSPPPVRQATALPFTETVKGLLDRLGGLIADPGREVSPDSNIPAGYTYVGQFIDHDITLDVSSSLDERTNANDILNMRTPALDLDSVYGRGPALQPYLYVLPTTGNPTAIKLRLGANTTVGPGGAAGSSGNPSGMGTPRDADVPRLTADPQTALIGDPRNDENLIVSQLHQTMLRFHNAVVDFLAVAGFPGDLFVEAKRITTLHYQWAVLHDFLGQRIVGQAALAEALSQDHTRKGSPFRMPVEFSVAAYRFGHSMIRDNYWVNFNFPEASLGQVFDFIRPPNLPVLSNWVVDFNAFFETGFPVPVNNKARKIDSVLAHQLEALPGASGIMAILATRNLRRGLSLGLPSGQGMAQLFHAQPLSAAELKAGLPANEQAVLDAEGGLLLHKTPLWYYVLREATLRQDGNRLGPVGAGIVARTFVRMLKRDADSILNQEGGFSRFLPSATPGQFTFADLVAFAGVLQPA